jgi:hypothetical protein
VLLATEPCALQPLNGAPALDGWLRVLATSARLRPLAERVVIATSAATAADAGSWAEQRGLSGCCVCVAGADAAAGSGGRAGPSSSDGAFGGPLSGELLGLLRQLQHPILEGASSVVLVDGGRAVEPGTRIARMVEASVVQPAAARVGVTTSLLAAAPPAPEAAAALGVRGGAAELELASRLQESSVVLALRPPVVHADAAAAAACRSPPLPAPLRATEGFRAGLPFQQAPPVVLAPVCVLSATALAGAQVAGGTLAEVLDRLQREGQELRSWQMEVRPLLRQPQACCLLTARRHGHGSCSKPRGSTVHLCVRQAGTLPVTPLPPAHTPTALAAAVDAGGVPGDLQLPAPLPSHAPAAVLEVGLIVGCATASRALCNQQGSCANLAGVAPLTIQSGQRRPIPRPPPPSPDDPKRPTVPEPPLSTPAPHARRRAAAAGGEREHALGGRRPRPGPAGALHAGPAGGAAQPPRHPPGCGFHGECLAVQAGAQEPRLCTACLVGV